MQVAPGLAEIGAIGSAASLSLAPSAIRAKPPTVCRSHCFSYSPSVWTPLDAVQTQRFAFSARRSRYAAVASLGAVTSTGSSSSNAIMQATVGSTAKILFICGCVGWLLQTGRLSEDTAPVLSKVAFNLLLPCMLLCKVGTTLANNFEWSLVGLPLIGLLQLAVGALGGMLANWALDPSAQRRFGWHPQNPARSAKAVAMSTAAASGIPFAASALLPSTSSTIPAGTRELVAACCTFGNSFTLPLVFMMSLLPPAAFERATGYTALFLVGWSPVLWSYGVRLLSAAAPPTPEDQQGPLTSFDEADVTTAQMALLADPSKQPENRSQAIFEANLMARRRLAGIKRRIEKALNPPLVGILLGILAAASPLGPHLFCPAGMQLPMELKVCFGALKLGVEALGLLAGGSLAVQTVVLAASLFQQSPDGDAQGSRLSSATQLSWTGEIGPPGAVPPARQLALPGEASRREDNTLDLPPRPARGAPPLPAAAARQGLLGLLLPRTALDWKILAAVGTVRFGLVPATSFFVVRQCARAGLLPADPTCMLSVLIQGAMPPAQNLAVLVNLKSSTRFLAPRLARLLLRLYIFAAVPVTLWTTLFVSATAAPVASTLL